MEAHDVVFCGLDIEFDSASEQCKPDSNLRKLDARYKIYMTARQDTELERQDFWAARNEQISSSGLHRLGPESLGVRTWLLTLPDYKAKFEGRM
jgi:hypothetical protein